MKIFPRIEWLRTGLLLAFCGGILNSYTYLWRGEVLATAETGNIVLMGLSLAEGDWIKAISYLLPITAFALGVFAAELARHRLERRGQCPQWRRMILWLEIFVIILVALCPMEDWDWIANIGIAFVSAIQIETFRNVRGCAAFTTMCTGNLRSGSDGMSQWILQGDIQGKNRSVIYFSLIFSFFLGVVACSLLSHVAGHYAVLLAILPLLLVYFIIRLECELV